MNNSFVKYVNDIGVWTVTKVSTNEGPDAAGNINDDSYDYTTEIGVIRNNKFEADAHFYFMNEQHFKEWIVDLYNTFVKEK